MLKSAIATNIITIKYNKAKLNKHLKGKDRRQNIASHELTTFVLSHLRELSIKNHMKRIPKIRTKIIFKDLRNGVYRYKTANNIQRIIRLNDKTLPAWNLLILLIVMNAACVAMVDPWFSVSAINAKRHKKHNESPCIRRDAINKLGMWHSLWLSYNGRLQMNNLTKTP